MPVRDSGWYKRPYRLSYVDMNGRTHNLAFHWKGARDADAKWLRDRPEVFRDLKVWDTGEPPVAR